MAFTLVCTNGTQELGIAMHALEYFGTLKRYVETFAGSQSFDVMHFVPDAVHYQIVFSEERERAIAFFDANRRFFCEQVLRCAEFLDCEPLVEWAATEYIPGILRQAQVPSAGRIMRYPPGFFRDLRDRERALFGFEPLPTTTVVRYRAIVMDEAAYAPYAALMAALSDREHRCRNAWPLLVAAQPFRYTWLRMNNTYLGKKCLLIDCKCTIK
jgi:hypothetical protein